ncbi:uncharacterized protein LOC127903673 isoform X2 [Citrus sinensis]|uniref:uncharacterized protein LOC127903673 isoform X2 n=1 Tax=Citrus sinensis TaxID=2711 RepID=UPI0022781A35|nr:uncharacterized protein LOC127903673 isoform X2 [Citrus sinensis]
MGFVLSLRSSITCQKLEELYELMHSGLKMDEIYAVEFIGGATVVPKLQWTQLTNFGNCSEEDDFFRMTSTTSDDTISCDNHLDRIKDWDINNFPRNQ